jgi:hypothetical protein
MKFRLKSLDSLAGTYKKVLVFDCEFWHVLLSKNDNVISQNNEYFFIPREIGGFLLEKVGQQWKLNKSFFVTLDKPLRDTVLPISKFSTVTPQTGWKLDEIEHRLGLPWGEAFYSKLSNQGKQAYNEGLLIYNSDPNIKEHHQDFSWYNKFMDIYSQSLIIVKGTGDIDALKNASEIFKFNYKNPLEVIDIADWNEDSRKICSTAKLAGTFDCIKKDLNEEIKTIADFLPLEKAHDPSTDASMTLLVALFIESQKP